MSAEEKQPSHPPKRQPVSTQVSLREVHLVELHMRPVEDGDREAVEQNTRTFSFHASVDDSGFTSMAIPHKELLPPNVTHILALKDGIDVTFKQEVVIAETFLQIAMMFIVRTDPPVDYGANEDWAKEFAEKMYDEAYPIMMSHASVAKHLMGRLIPIPRMPKSMVTFETIADHGGVYVGDVAAAMAEESDE